METSNPPDEFVQKTKDELKKLEIRKKALLNFLATYENLESKKEQLNLELSQNGNNSTIRERILAAMDTLIKNKHGVSVRVPEIHDHVLKNNIDIGKGKHPRSLIFSVIRQELNKEEKSKIIKVRKGLYKLK